MNVWLIDHNIYVYIVYCIYIVIDHFIMLLWNIKINLFEYVWFFPHMIIRMFFYWHSYVWSIYTCHLLICATLVLSQDKSSHHFRFDDEISRVRRVDNNPPLSCLEYDIDSQETHSPSLIANAEKIKKGRRLKVVVSFDDFRVIFDLLIFRKIDLVLFEYLLTKWKTV